MKKEHFKEISKVATKLVTQITISKHLEIEYQTMEAKKTHEELIKLLTPIARKKAQNFAEGSIKRLDIEILTSLALFEGLTKALRVWDYNKFPNHFLNVFSSQVYNMFINYVKSESTGKKEIKYHTENFNISDNEGNSINIIDVIPSKDNVELEVETNMLLNFILKNLRKRDKDTVVALLKSKDNKTVFQCYCSKERTQIYRLKNKVVDLLK